MNYTIQKIQCEPLGPHYKQWDKTGQLLPSAAWDDSRAEIEQVSAQKGDFLMQSLQA